MQRNHGRTFTFVFSFPFFLIVALLSACAQSEQPGKTASNHLTQRGLAGTSWQLLSIQSMSDEQPTVQVETPDRYTLHFLDDGRANMRLNCNRGMGTYKCTPTDSGDSGQLSFGPIAMTRMFCPQPSLDERIARDLDFVRSYLLRGGNLYLSLMADGGIYEWQPLPQKP